MEKLTETGKRVERLLYSSIFIIISGVIFYYLSAAIAEDKNQKKYSLLTEYRDLLTKKQADLSLALEMEAQYAKYNEHLENRTDKERSDKLRENKRKLEQENKAREKLDLPLLDYDKELNKSEVVEAEEFPLINIEQINNLSKKLNLELVKSISESKDIYHRAFTEITIDSLFYDRYLMDFFLDKKESSIKEIMSEINEKLIELNDGMVKVFNVDTPIQFPFSLGDMKSKVSLYNIQSAGLIVMPLLLSIWIGAVTMTRSREIYYIKKYKKVMASYPHILNFYYVIDKDTCTFKNEVSSFHRITLGVKKDISEAKGTAFFCFLLRLITSITFFFLTITPFYFGALAMGIQLSFGMRLLLLSLLIINIFQALTFIFHEFLLATTFFTIDGEKHESI